MTAANHGFEIEILPTVEEDLVWERHVKPHLAGVESTAKELLFYAFTEMFNNVIDHSEGSRASVEIVVDAEAVRLTIADDGVGIFRKVAQRAGLVDERHALFELTKGKLTTAKERHSGEGIFFTSRACDAFLLASGGQALGCTGGEDWRLDRIEQSVPGTRVSLQVSRAATRSLAALFEAYTSSPDEDLSFSRTRVPVALAMLGEENLISRSQARRVLARLDAFTDILLDFQGVQTVGQAFADEIFRVFRRSHPELRITALRMNQAVARMVARAQSAE